MRNVHISLGLVQQGGHYLLQLRNGDPKIGAAGLIGCFGGKVDEGEEPVDAIARELSEETTIKAHRDTFRSLGEVNVISDHQLEPVSVHAKVFHLVLESVDEVAALEGELIRWTKEQILQNLEKLTPATREVFETLLVDEEL